ncbi:uncharacterized protein [Onthophagus taurus]|uniref:uncharacterized protein n=1 Tax=Onthophagus taurus TaxID=166361 RepID=UPI000C20078E|nr:acidic endochitinase SP2-like [Onthophagus taurus]
MGFISEQKLENAMRNLGYRPKSRHIEAIVKETNSSFDDKYNAAMFLAQCAHESTGYHDIEEIAYKGATWSPYGDGAPGKSYHGRGFIQLTWDYNYKSCSHDIGRGNQLYKHPEMVASDSSLGAEVSVWFWQKNVETYRGFNSRRNFGITTKAINGGHECRGRNVDQSKNRYRCYVEICDQMGITPADECGCYN